MSMPRQHSAEWIGNFRGSRQIQVIETVVLQGKGTEESPYRNVTYYNDKDGRLLAVNDPVHENDRFKI